MGSRHTSRQHTFNSLTDSHKALVVFRESGKGYFQFLNGFSLMTGLQDLAYAGMGSFNSLTDSHRVEVDVMEPAYVLSFNSLTDSHQDFSGCPYSLK